MSIFARVRMEYSNSIRTAYIEIFKRIAGGIIVVDESSAKLLFGKGCRFLETWKESWGVCWSGAENTWRFKLDGTKTFE